MYDEPITSGDDLRGVEQSQSPVHAIGEVLSELLAQYQTRFPELRITVVEVPAAA